MRTALIAVTCLGLGALAGAGLQSASAGPPTPAAAEAQPEAESEAKSIRPAVEPVGEPPAEFSRYTKLDRFARALAIIEQYYVRPVDGERLIDAALTGLVAELDPHTNYLAPADAKILQEDVAGRFGGVGLVVSLGYVPELGAAKPESEPESDAKAPSAPEPGKSRMVLVVDDVIPGGPAERAGVVVGDRIVEIADKPVAHYPDLHEAVMVMRGPAGSEVHFTFEHADQPARRVAVTRAIVDPPAVEVRWLGEGLGVLRLRDFQEASAREVESGITELRKQAEQAGQKLDGLVLDLRDNGGGLLDQAIDIVDLFVAEGVIVRTRARQGKLIDEVHAQGPGTIRDLPLVVLTNKASASASEIVAGALQDHGRALIVGERSYGKGSVQAPFEIGGGAVLKLTTALYYTPDDRLIQASGIVPDVLVGRTIAPLDDSRPTLEPERADPKHLAPEDFGRKTLPETRESPARVAAGDDGQLLAAIDHLQAWAKLGARKHRR
ncbi:S41 family peptidase [Nannocystaceae bacterium ST9]